MSQAGTESSSPPYYDIKRTDLYQSSGADDVLQFRSEPDKFPFDLLEAYRLRIKAFANGAMLAIGNGDHSNLKFNEIKTLTNEAILTSTGSRQQLNQYLNQLAEVSGLTRKDIALGEAFWVWQHYERPPLTTRFYTKQGLLITQQESVQQAPLTQVQKTDLLRIHQEPTAQPEWFKKLPIWAQVYLKTIVPMDLNGDWQRYERCIPATLRHIPGQANATVHTLTVTGKDKVAYTTTALRQGVPTPYEMPASEQQRHADENIAQMLDATEPKKTFGDYWGNDVNMSKIAPPVLLGGLVTPSDQSFIQGRVLDFPLPIVGVLAGKENNTLFRDVKSHASSTYQTSHPELVLFDLNTATNNVRGYTPVAAAQGFIDHANKIVAQAANGPKKTKLEQAIVQLERHNDAAQPRGRNKNLYLAALYDVATRCMGGISTGNCKSSKDRKGLALLMADAMMVHYHQYNAFPALDATGAARKQFVDIFVALYCSGHHLLIAHDNSPGSPGIKDEGNLDQDIIKALGETNKLSKRVAENNKPASFFDKHRDKIRLAGWVLFGLLSIISGTLIATGVFAPVGILTGLTGAKIGAFLSGVISVASAIVPAAAVAAVVYQATAMHYERKANQLPFIGNGRDMKIGNTSGANALDSLGGQGGHAGNDLDVDSDKRQADDLPKNGVQDNVTASLSMSESDHKPPSPPH